eukprot:SAG31_NODE_8620_length_1419_cov_0.976515_2_plen_293_part_00
MPGTGWSTRKGGCEQGEITSPTESTDCEHGVSISYSAVYMIYIGVLFGLLLFYSFTVSWREHDIVCHRLKCMKKQYEDDGADEYETEYHHGADHVSKMQMGQPVLTLERDDIDIATSALLVDRMRGGDDDEMPPPPPPRRDKSRKTLSSVRQTPEVPAPPLPPIRAADYESDDDLHPPVPDSPYLDMRHPHTCCERRHEPSSSYDARRSRRLWRLASSRVKIGLRTDPRVFRPHTSPIFVAAICVIMAGCFVVFMFYVKYAVELHDKTVNKNVDFAMPEQFTGAPFFSLCFQ